MSKIKLHIDPEDPSPAEIRKYKNYSKVQRRFSRFYTFHGLMNMLKKHKLLFVALVLAGLVLLIFVLE